MFCVIHTWGSTPMPAKFNSTVKARWNAVWPWEVGPLDARGACPIHFWIKVPYQVRHPWGMMSCQVWTSSYETDETRPGASRIRHTGQFWTHCMIVVGEGEHIGTGQWLILSQCLKKVRSALVFHISGSVFSFHFMSRIDMWYPRETIPRISQRNCSLQVKDVVAKISADHRHLHSSVTKVGKAIDRVSGCEN